LTKHLTAWPSRGFWTGSSLNPARMTPWGCGVGDADMWTGHCRSGKPALLIATIDFGNSRLQELYLRNEGATLFAHIPVALADHTLQGTQWPIGLRRQRSFIPPIPPSSGTLLPYPFGGTEGSRLELTICYRLKIASRPISHFVKLLQLVSNFQPCRIAWIAPHGLLQGLGPVMTPPGTFTPGRFIGGIQI